MSEMEMVWRCAQRVAAADIRVLIIGETGVGKEVMARAIHGMSPRCREGFVPFDCAGALPGALPLELADGSTFFLDRIGDLPLDLQTRLLSIMDRHTGVRFLATADERIVDDVDTGAFRVDLLHRIGGVTLRIPPLRERRAEIEPLARNLLDEICRRRNLEQKRLSAGAIASLVEYTWPGNIRELSNVIERAVLLADQPLIERAHLLLEAVSTKRTAQKARLHDEIAILERDRIAEALERSGGNRSRAARILGISRRTITTKVKELGLETIGRA